MKRKKIVVSMIATICDLLLSIRLKSDFKFPDTLHWMSAKFSFSILYFSLVEFFAFHSYSASVYRLDNVNFFYSQLLLLHTYIMWNNHAVKIMLTS